MKVLLVFKRIINAYNFALLALPLVVSYQNSL